MGDSDSCPPRNVLCSCPVLVESVTRIQGQTGTNDEQWANNVRLNIFVSCSKANENEWRNKLHVWIHAFALYGGNLCTYKGRIGGVPGTQGESLLLEAFEGICVQYLQRVRGLNDIRVLLHKDHDVELVVLDLCGRFVGLILIPVTRGHRLH